MGLINGDFVANGWVGRRLIRYGRKATKWLRGFVPSIVTNPKTHPC